MADILNLSPTLEKAEATADTDVVKDILPAFEAALQRVVGRLSGAKITITVELPPAS